MAEDKRLHMECGDCQTRFATEDTFPMDVRKLNKVIKTAKCPTCGVGAKRLYLRSAPRPEAPETPAVAV
jgi:hypothetical protein